MAWAAYVQPSLPECSAMPRLLPLLIFLLLFCGCATPQRMPGAAAGVSFLALGDSYTIGEGVGAADRWPVQLAALARQQGLALKPLAIIARTSWTTAELQTAIAEAHNRNTYGLVALLIGVNNQYRGQPLGQYRTEFRALLATAVGFAAGQPGRVVVLSVPDWGQSPFAGRQGRDPARIGAEIDRLNAVAQDECRRAGIAYVDIAPLTRAAGGDATQFARDGLHYAGPQLRQWAQLVLPVVRPLLRPRSGHDALPSPGTLKAD